MIFIYEHESTYLIFHNLYSCSFSLTFLRHIEKNEENIRNKSAFVALISSQKFFSTVSCLRLLGTNLKFINTSLLVLGDPGKLGALISVVN